MRGPAFCVLLALASAACGGASSPAATPALTTAPAATAQPTSAATAAPPPTASPAPTAAVVLVEMGDHFFAPAEITVKVGTRVTWKSVGQSTHDLAARDGSFKDPGMSFGQTFSFTFSRAGRYPYVCAQHEGDGMVGTVTVID